jgi:hypothetical protein
MQELIQLLRDFLIAEGEDGDRKVYHFLIRGAVVEIVV